MAQDTSSAPAIQAIAEHLPIQSNAVDAALSVLTIHHSTNASPRCCVSRTAAWSSSPETTPSSDGSGYLPAAQQTDADLAVPIAQLIPLLGDPTIVAVPVPHDCAFAF